MNRLDGYRMAFNKIHTSTDSNSYYSTVYLCPKYLGKYNIRIDALSVSTHYIDHLMIKYNYAYLYIVITYDHRYN